MWISSCQRWVLIRASNGRGSTTRPSTTRKPSGLFIHPLTEINVERAGEARDHDRHAGEEVRARAQPVPAVDVDGHEDRLDEERDALQAERDPEHAAEGGHEL